MDTISELTAESWGKLVAIAEKLDVGDALRQTYLFRGQANFRWKVEPTLHRATTNGGRLPLPPPEELLRIEHAMTERFLAVAPNHLPSATLAATHALLDWWPLMRHHGVPTRVLDWTSSFYVATYFAAASEPDSDGAIYLVHAHTLNAAMKATHGPTADHPRAVDECDRVFRRPDAPAVIHIYARRSAMLDRMVAQQGVFMVNQNVAADLEATLAGELSKFATPTTEVLRKVRIPADQKPLIMRRLRAMNVTAASLFPGLDGIGRQLDELVRNP